MKSSTCPTILDLSIVPDDLRNNWAIYLCLREDARVAHARAVAGPADNSKRWVDAFDSASRDWVALNPIDPFWDGAWPENAGFHLGNAALEQARKIVRGEA